ncbi:Hint domain-containing protein [Nioella sp.]|uniref:Hint domain-containing protein n=1 Tax=Nioella sp. TaxID=1912091 RepID=UPI003A86BA57
MANYNIAGYAEYDGTSGIVSFVASGPSTYTLDDKEGDTTFEVGDLLNGETFEGSVDVPLVAGGTLRLPVTSYLGTTYVYIPSGYSLSDFTFPSSLDYSTFNTTDFPTCFLGGSLIATPEGECAVEALAIGDALLTEDGRAVAVKWIGRQTVFTTFGPAERMMPVRFAAGSLGDGLPHADLTVTADHGMLIDGIICHAGALVNGTTSRTSRCPRFQGYTVYHIETEAHEIILANGAPAETFIDNVSRRSFDNFAEFEALYGGVPEMEELDYPRAMSARQVPPRIKAKLDGRKAA